MVRSSLSLNSPFHYLPGETARYPAASPSAGLAPPFNLAQQVADHLDVVLIEIRDGLIEVPQSIRIQRTDLVGEAVIIAGEAVLVVAVDGGSVARFAERHKNRRLGR